MTITFSSSNRHFAYAPQPKQKCKLQTDITVITNTKEDCDSYPPLSNSQTPSTWKDDVSSMTGSIRYNTMTQVKQIYAEQMKKTIRKNRDQITGMATELVTTLLSLVIQQSLIIIETRTRKTMGRYYNDKLYPKLVITMNILKIGR